ncbi:MAG: N-6 DNA methylase, partial [Anaerolineae bacterium]|nr:N-6 DNA methylase [Anaerolineae bacterium]
MPAPERIKQLIETFEKNINEYRFHKNETELRRQFLDPFFEALGWDVDNKKGYDERNKEVAHEYSVEIEGQQKKADYAFRTGRDSFDFLVEAKKPSVKIEISLDPAFQLRRYGWSAGLPINILTDFEHFAVYDCRTRPNYSKDKVGTSRIKILHYKEYVERWDEIADLFSPESIRKGALDQFKDQLKGKKGTQEVDEAFLEEIEAWRETLARNIATRNKHLNLNEDQVNFAVQMTIDRIIFLRIAEERGMERDRRLLELCESPTPSVLRTSPPNSNPAKTSGAGERNLGENQIYKNLLELFQQADARYNSGLFHFKKDKERENPDRLTPSLDVDDKVLKDIIKDLYYPSPYAFNYIPTEILGSVYERFLGKVIRLTAGGNAKVEDKPEVRKAGGVYYTPTYIVDYIVKNTVGRIVNPPATPDDVSKIKIVDPACGSGSFLLGAYQFLLDWHLDWYTSNDPEKYLKNKTLLTADNKTYRLSIDEKKRILLNNIYGVDLDPQAVEVTKLSLLLKVVEDPGQLKMFEEGHILPDLNRNIKNGNALIGTDYFSGQMFASMEEMKRVNPFDWKSEFPQI